MVFHFIVSGYSIAILLFVDEMDYQFHPLCPLGCLVLKQPKTFMSCFWYPSKRNCRNCTMAWLVAQTHLEVKVFFCFCGNVIVGLRGSWVCVSPPREMSETSIIDVILWEKKNPPSLFYPIKLKLEAKVGIHLALQSPLQNPSFSANLF